MKLAPKKSRPMKASAAICPLPSCTAKTASNALSSSMRGSPARPATKGTFAEPEICRYLARPLVCRSSSRQRTVSPTTPARRRVAITSPAGSSNFVSGLPSLSLPSGRPQAARGTYLSQAFQPRPCITGVGLVHIEFIIVPHCLFNYL